MECDLGMRKRSKGNCARRLTRSGASKWGFDCRRPRKDARLASKRVPGARTATTPSLDTRWASAKAVENVSRTPRVATDSFAWSLGATPANDVAQRKRGRGERGGEQRQGPANAQRPTQYVCGDTQAAEACGVDDPLQHIPTHGTAIHTAMPARAMQGKPHQRFQAGLTGLRCPLWSTWPRRLGGQRGWPEDSATAANDTQKTNGRLLQTSRLHAQTFHAPSYRDRIPSPAGRLWR
jgi:hypothetical protein